jgi:hypothetical protein
MDEHLDTQLERLGRRLEAVKQHVVEPFGRVGLNLTPDRRDSVMDLLVELDEELHNLLKVLAA